MKMSPCKILLFVLVVFLVDVPNVWGQDSPSFDTVLRYESPSIIHKKEENKKPHVPLFFESTRLQNDIQPKSLNVNKHNLQFEFKDCGNESSIIKFLQLKVTPNPIVTPGQIWLSFAVEFKKAIVDNLKANVKITRKIGSVSIQIPCIGSVGSCIYDNICDLLKSIKSCPFAEQGLKCTCPFEKGTVTLKPRRLNIGSNVVPSGTYQINTILSHNNAFAGCVDITLTLSTP